MKQKQAFGALIVLLAATNWTPGTALRCYSCDSVSNPQCGDPFEAKESSSFQCGGNTQASENVFNSLRSVFPGLQQLNPQQSFRGMCMKTVTTARNSRTITFRGCSYFGTQTCSMVSSAVTADGGQLEHCEMCTEDLCNAAFHAVTPAFIVILVSSAVGLLAYS